MKKSTFYIILGVMLTFICVIAGIYLIFGKEIKTPVSSDTGVFDDVFKRTDSKDTIEDKETPSEESSESTQVDGDPFSKERIAKACEASEDKFYYRNIDENLHELYAQLYITLTEMREGVVLCSKDEEEIEYVYTCVLSDNPQIYYNESYKLVFRYQDDDISTIEITPEYVFTKEEVEQNNTKIDEYTKCFLENAPIAASDYDKIKYTYDFICLNTKYSDTAANSFSMISVILENQGNCASYAQCFQYLLSKLNVEAPVVYGTDADGYRHSFNLVKCEDAYYYADVTWGDNDGSLVGYDECPSYDYLNITTKEMLLDHTIDNVVSYPNCVSVKDNYYYREGAVLDSYDEEKISVLVNSALDNASNRVSLKCTSKDTYDEVVQRLGTNAEIFTMLPYQFTNGKYIQNDDLFIFTFVWK